MMLFRTIVWIVLILVSIELNTLTSGLNLTVIHNNDFHARYLPIRTNNYAECYANDSEDCVGGAARTVYQINHFRNTTKNLLNLNAGDHFQGSIWYTLFKADVVAEFASLMKHDVMAIGNHEFDDGSNEFKKFIDIVNDQMESNLTILSCNIEFLNGSVLNGLVEKSTIKVFENRSIAIIGYTTPDTSFLSQPGDSIQFRDEIDAIKEEINKLKKKNSELNIFIAVGHSGLERDLQIARAIPELDLVVGGHSHSFMFTGNNYPSVEVPEGDYPVVIEHNSKQKTLYVQAFAFGKYLGYLDLAFDDDGNIEAFKGEPIFLNSTTAQDEKTQELVKMMIEELASKFNTTIGTAKVDLNAQNCRKTECNLGNTIADGLVSYFSTLNTNTTLSANQCDQLIGLVNGGNIRTSISKGPITFRDVISTLPFGNRLGILTLTGEKLIDLFEQSSTQYRKGGFMQVSGLKVHYREKDNKVKLDKLEANCHDKWNEVELESTYKVVINSFLMAGGDNYTIDNKNWIDYQLIDSDVFSSYIENKKIIEGVLEGRIVINDHGTNSAISLQTLTFNVFVVLLLNLMYFFV